MWFDVEERYNATHIAEKHCTFMLWFDVEERYNATFIDWGRVYVLDTCNGAVIKKLFSSENADKVICKSINPDYPPFEVSVNDIYGGYRVLMCMSAK